MSKFTIKHFQICTTTGCYGYGPSGHRGLEARRQGEELEVEVDDVEAVKKSMTTEINTSYVPVINDCQSTAIKALKAGKAKDEDLEKVACMGNLSLQSVEKGKALDEFIKKGGGT